MKTLIRSCALAAVLAVGALPAAAQTPATPSAGRLALTFEVGAETGAIMVVLFDSEAAYSGGAPVRQARVDVAGGQRQAVFEGLPAGDYAARAFHDVDGNGRMNTNPFGMPTEPYAFSNNAVGNMGPASWDRARVAVSGDVAQTLTIR